MDLLYGSTRGGYYSLRASQAILQGMADDGGLFVPQYIPPLPCSLKELSGMDYRESAFRIMKAYLTDFTDEELRYCIENAYDGRFENDEIVPLSDVDGVWYMELFHGPTLAFKDIALAVLPYLMKVSMKKNGDDAQSVVLTATSGDTGKAAMAGFADVPGTRIIVFYPKDGVSAIQRQQMVTQKGANVQVTGVDGNFDDCQRGVKAIFADETLRGELWQKGYRLSSANSINIGRLIPQIVYYVYAYTRLLSMGEIADGEEINIVVPTGNFGNILAAYYASLMGLPVHRLICASNENRVLYDFFTTGTYDANRPFIRTNSPSMDILISSNLERLLYQISGCDAKTAASLMDSLSRYGKYSVTEEMREGMSIFRGGYAAGRDRDLSIAKTFDSCGYVMDTHTAAAAAVYEQYRKDTRDETRTLIASTASPYKFAPAVLASLEPDFEKSVCQTDDELGAAFICADELARLSGGRVPEAVKSLAGAPVRHCRTCDVGEMETVVRRFLM